MIIIVVEAIIFKGNRFMTLNSMILPPYQVFE